MPSTYSLLTSSTYALYSSTACIGSKSTQPYLQLVFSLPGEEVRQDMEVCPESLQQQLKQLGLLTRPDLRLLLGDI